MSYCGYVTTLKNVRPHPNADRMKLADIFGNTVCVSLDFTEGEIGVYFPVDGQLSEEFCSQHDLVRRKDENNNPAGGYLDPDKRNIKAVKLRGEKSDGLFMPISCLAYTGVNLDDLNVGDTVTVINGHEICKKYIPRSNHKSSNSTAGNKTRKHHVPIAPLFSEHADTEQLAYNLDAFKAGDEIEITLKMHGTSQRTGYLPVHTGYKDSIFRRIINKIIMGLKVRKDWGSDGRNKLYHSLKHGEPIYDWGYVSGTRRTVLENFEGGYYGSNAFRKPHSKFFEGKLNKGEEIFYEVVGFTHTETPIMASGKTPKDPEVQKMYGEEMVFSYGCEPSGKKIYYGKDEDGVYGIEEIKPQSDIYVYRMTMTNEDGFTVEYTPDFMRYRCEQMGVKTVPVMWKGIIPEDLKTEDFFETDGGEFNDWIYAENAGEWVKNKAEQYYDGPDPIGQTHVREGVVVRVLNRPKFTAFKHKNFLFKQISGIAIEQVDANTVDKDILEEM